MDTRLLEIQAEIEHAMSRHVCVTHGEVERLVAADLLDKYRGACDRRDDKNAELLRNVLTAYYLTEDEFKEYRKSPNA